jgi:hypothetical protein
VNRHDVDRGITHDQRRRQRDFAHFVLFQHNSIAQPNGRPQILHAQLIAGHFFDDALIARHVAIFDHRAGKLALWAAA